jgi:hypothetical protein
VLAGVAAADLVLQAVVLLLALAWVAPATAGHQLASGAAPSARATVESSIATQWLVLWFGLSLFPAVALGVLARRRVRQAYESAAVAAAAAAEAAADESADGFF